MTAPNRNVFTNPKTGAVYDWPVNHSTEEAIVVTRQMGDGANTDNIGLVPQQGAATPLILKWKGTFFTDAEVIETMAWWKLCETQTINATDFSGSQYELIITDFEPQRVPCVRNPRVSSGTNAFYTWQYTITFRILKAFSGIWTSFTP